MMSCEVISEKTGKGRKGRLEDGSQSSRKGEVMNFGYRSEVISSIQYNTIAFQHTLTLAISFQ
jgi:hypothetical protein